jgi:hypothetical protein
MKIYMNVRMCVCMYVYTLKRKKMKIFILNEADVN